MKRIRYYFVSRAPLIGRCLDPDDDLDFWGAAVLWLYAFAAWSMFGVAGYVVVKL